MDRAFWTPQYYQKLLNLGPVAGWMLDEKSGTVAYELVSGRVAGVMNGAHSAGVDHGQPGIGDGRTSSGYDGAADYTNVFSAALQAAFNGDAGTAMIWVKVSAAGDWTDGVRREAFRVIDTTDSQEYFWIAKDSVNNQWWLRYTAGNIAEDVRVASGATLTWTQLALTWDVNAGIDGEVRAYADGVQIGATQTALSAWVGAINEAFVGAANATPTNLWKGDLARCFLFDRALTPTEVTYAYVVI